MPWYTPTAANPLYYYYFNTATTTATSYMPWQPPTATTASTTLQWYSAQMAYHQDADDDARAPYIEAVIRPRRHIAAPAVHARCTDEAGTRALELLREHLTPEQRAMFDEQKCFFVEGGRSKRLYRIRGDRNSIVANIDVIEQNLVTHRLCGHIDFAAVQVPYGDQLLAQKLMLQFSEDDFLRIANRHG